MRFNRLRKKLLPLLLISVIFSCTVFSSAGAASINSLKDQYNSLEQKTKALQNKINAEKNKIQKSKEYAENIEESITNTRKQIDLLDDQILGLDKEIATLDKEIEETRTKMADNYETFKKRLRAICMSGGTSNLEILMGAKDFGDYLARSQLLKSVSKHDQELLESIEASLQKIQQESEEVESKRNVAAGYKKLAQNKRNQLQSQYDQNKEYIEKLENSVEFNAEELRKANEAKEAQYAKIQEAIREAERKRRESQDGSPGVVSEKGFMWPVPGGGTYISSGWGYRAQFGKFHYGIDITGGGIYGRSIVASKSGTVILSGYSSVGYGNYIVIDHGDGYSTVYGHCSSLIATEGQVVKQGDVIARVGSTGWSTGPHLHFEIRVDGVQKNPANYF